MIIAHPFSPHPAPTMNTAAPTTPANAPTTNTAMRTNMAWRNGTAPAVGGAGSGATVWGEADMID